jgi:1-deoxy-D-xylulose-5-phosphate reductoisomerase
VDAGKSGGTYPAVLCAADEVAVELFLSHRISFIDIAKIVQKILEQHRAISQPSLHEILAADDWARECAIRLSPGYCEESKRRNNPGIER